MSLRDANVIIIETTRTVVRAGLGLHDLLRTPSVEFPARVGLRRNASEDSIQNANDVTADPSASSSRTDSAATPSGATVKDYLVGTQLDEALAAGQDVLISWPFSDGDIKDWTQTEAIWKYVIFNQLQRRRVQNESPVLLSLFSGPSRDTYEHICQIFFERFNVAGFAILERPIAQVYATNNLTGVIVDIGDEITDIIPVYEGFLLHPARRTTPLGVADCQNYLATLLRSNTSIVASLSPPEAPLHPDDIHTTLMSLVKQLWEEGHIRVPSYGETAIVEDDGVTDIAAVLVAGKEKAVIESGMKKKANAKASAAEQARAREIEALDLITIEFRGHSLTLGKERHRFCEPLFDPNVLKGLQNLQGQIPREGKPLSLQEATGLAVYRTDLEQRSHLWSGLFVVGDITRYIRGIGGALQSRLTAYIISPEILTESQPRFIRVLSVPEYYSEYRETGNGLAAFLGSSIVAKVIFNDSGGRSFVSKADYTAKGPHAIIEMNPSLL